MKLIYGLSVRNRKMYFDLKNRNSFLGAKQLEFRINSIDDDSEMEDTQYWEIISEECKKKEIKISIHMFDSINLGERVNCVREVYLKAIKKLIDLIVGVGGEYIVLHLGMGGFSYESHKKKERLMIVVDSLQMLLSYCPSNIYIAIENMIRIESAYKCYLGDCKEDFLFIFDRIDDPRLKMIFDVGHANIKQLVPPIVFIDQLYNKILAFHLHWNDGNSDQHNILTENWMMEYDQLWKGYIMDKPIIIENNNIIDMHKTIRILTNIIKDTKK